MGSLTAMLGMVGMLGGLGCVQACDGTRAVYFTDIRYHEH